MIGDTIYRKHGITAAKFHNLMLRLPYRAKLCRAKLLSGETIRRAKFSSLNEKFVTFARRKVLPIARRKVLPNKTKVS